MDDTYHKLLDATVSHLQALKARGVRHVPVTAETLSALRSPAAVPRSAAPALAPKPVVTEPIKPVVPRFAAPLFAPPPLVISADKAAERPARLEALEKIRERAAVCILCPHLASSRKHVVFGVGDVNASLMFVGEAPGADEDAQGEPFVGKAGQLLTKIIQAMGLSRDGVYIANILKCRPDTPGQSSGNRKPTPHEMSTCIPFLHEQIDLIGPKVLVGLGATAVEGLLGESTGITKLRGHWQEYRGIPLMPTYHPAYLLRNQAVSEKRKVWEDMLAVMEKLSMPISEKQRGFLPGRGDVLTLRF